MPVREEARIPQIEVTSRLRGSAVNPQSPHPEQAETSAPVAIEDLLWRMREGDREAAAEFLRRFGARIQRRIRGKLGPSVRRLFDTMDIISTLGRRLDLYVMAGRLDVANEKQLWRLLHTMADHALVDKVRFVKQARSMERHDGEFARQQAHRTKEAEMQAAATADVELDRCLSMIDDPVDRQILSLWLADATFVDIGLALNMTEDAVRKRYSRVQTTLKERMRAASS